MLYTAEKVRTNSQVTYSSGPLHMDKQRQNDQLKPIYNSSVPIKNIALKTSRERWTIETSGERGSGRSVLAARRIYYVCMYVWMIQSISSSEICKITRHRIFSYCGPVLITALDVALVSWLPHVLPVSYPLADYKYLSKHNCVIIIHIIYIRK